MTRLIHAAHVAVSLLALLALPHDLSGAELLLVLDPRSSLALRVLSEPSPDTALVLTVASGESGSTVRLLVESRRWLIGPVVPVGGLAELDRPTGGSAVSDRWFEPSAISGDAALAPASRVGVGWSSRPSTGRSSGSGPSGASAWDAVLTSAVWHSGGAVTVAAAATAARPELGFVELVGAASARAELEAGFPGLAATLFGEDPEVEEEGWFSDPAPAARGVQAALRGAITRGDPGVGWGRIRVAGGMFASWTPAVLPGVLFRGALDARPVPGVELVSLVRVATPGVRDPRGELVEEVLSWSVGGTVAGGPLTLALTGARTIPAGSAAYDRVGLARGDPESAATTCDARLSLTRSPQTVLRSLALRGAVDVSAGAGASALPEIGEWAESWRVSMDGRIVWSVPAVIARSPATAEVRPRVAWESDRTLKVAVPWSLAWTVPAAGPRRGQRGFRINGGVEWERGFDGAAAEGSEGGSGAFAANAEIRITIEPGSGEGRAAEP